MNSMVYWLQPLIGFALTVLIETPLLMVALSPRHPWRHRLFAGAWLTSCSYPIVVVVLPYFFSPAGDRLTYLLVAETFAPASECLLFWAAFHRKQGLPRATLAHDYATIVVANLASFAFGELWYIPLWT